MHHVVFGINCVILFHLLYPTDSFSDSPLYA